MGVAPDVDIHPCSIPPYFFGGNIDVNDLTEGSLLFLPVQVEGAKFYIGDPHFAQGDAEVSLTALEAPLRATLRLTVIPAQKAHALFGSTTAPIAYAHGNLLALGLGDNLDIALRESVENSIGLLSSLFGLPERVIYLYLSAAVNFDISQAVDITKGVHSRIPLAHFTEHLPGGSVDGFQRLIHDISLDIQ
jgi:acetamidase/formamidase